MKRKQIIAVLPILLLVMAFSFQTIHKGWMLVDYLVHTEKYIEHCENKDKPQMHCDGKCQLAKNDVDTSSDQQPQEHRTSSLQLYSFLYFEDVIFQLNFEKLEVIHKSYFTYQVPQGVEVLQVLQRPPIV